MFLDQPLAWATGHGPVVLVAGVLLAALGGFIVHRTSGAVLTAGIGALVATSFSADTSWRFAGDRLGMQDNERLALFAAGEVALLACAVMARANKRATATDTEAGTPGVPGVLVWCITGVQLVPAFAESGVLGGTVRAVFGPVMAALLWHLAMGLEIRVSRPEALSTGVPAQIGRELRERLLSYMGLAVRGRTAAQVSRDRATARAVRLASRRHLGWWGRAALKASVARSGAAVDASQRHQLLQQLAARRNASALRDVELPTPWTAAPVPEAYPGTPLGVAGAELRRMDPVDAVLQVHAAHPDAGPATLASLCTEYGVPVSEAQVQVALHAAPPPVPARVQVRGDVPAPAPRLELFPVPPADPVSQPDAHQAVPDTIEYAYQHGDLHLDVTTEAQVRAEHACAVPAQMIRPARTRTEVHARVPDRSPGTAPDRRPPTRLSGEGAPLRPATADPARTPARVHAVPAPGVHASQQVPPVLKASGTAGTGVPDELLERARRVDADHIHTHGRPAPIRVLKAALGVGQPKAELVRQALSEPSPRAGARHG
ncbi:hypothetical protein ABZT17_12130 [Streptomyces sp. NPDC005648]|uniref:hypothetical protein n=1 Tax=Streptomyces sp. NPDC005648 TaxID=3157044 RepID=UPI0033BBE439